MNLNLDQLADPAARVLEWDFAITLGGQIYPVAPITVGQIGELQQAMNSGEQAKLTAVVEGLLGIAGAASPLPGARPEVLVAVIAGTIQYFERVTRKNFEGLSAWVKAEMASDGPTVTAAKSSTSSNSSAHT